MTKDEVVTMFDNAIKRQSNPDKVAHLELAKYYFTEPEFRKAFEDYMFTYINATEKAQKDMANELKSCK